MRRADDSASESSPMRLLLRFAACSPLEPRAGLPSVPMSKIVYFLGHGFSPEAAPKYPKRKTCECPPARLLLPGGLGTPGTHFYAATVLAYDFFRFVRCPPVPYPPYRLRPSDLRLSIRFFPFREVPPCTLPSLPTTPVP